MCAVYEQRWKIQQLDLSRDDDWVLLHLQLEGAKGLQHVAEYEQNVAHAQGA